MKNKEVSVTYTNRIEYIDLIRALGIVFMIMGHIPFGNSQEGFDKWIHAFHMPLFFIVSGYFYKKKTFSKVLTSRVKSLIIPYFVFGILHTILSFTINRKIDIRSIYILFYENTADSGVAIAGALWFLTAMFFADIIYNIIDNFKGAWKHISVCLVTVAGMMFTFLLPFRLPFGLDAAMIGLGLIHIGRVLRDNAGMIFKVSFVYSCLGIVFFSVLSIKSDYINMRTGQYGTLVMFWINSIGMTLSLWNFFRSIDTFINNHVKIIKMKWPYNIGRDSIIYLCFNQLMIRVTSKVLHKVFIELPSSLIVLEKALILVLVLIELEIIRRVICNTKLKLLIGR